MRWWALRATIAVLALAGCGGGTGAPPTLPKVTPPPGNSGSPPPKTFNASSVHITEIPLPQPSPAADGPIAPSAIDVGNDGAVYFGQMNVNLSSFGSFGIFRYAGGTISETLPAPAADSSEGGVDAIDARDSSTVFWSSSYQQIFEPLSFGDMMECGAGTGTAALCTFPVFSGFITSILTAKDGTVWTAGSQCCGAGAGGYPAQVPAVAAENAFALDISTGPGGDVWGILVHNGPIYQFAPDGTVLNTYALPAGSVIEGSHAIVEGADGALWFTDAGNNAIARLAPGGQIAEFKVPTPNSGVQSITLAADGGMWFTESTADKIGRIDSSGKIYEFAVPTANAQPTAIAAASPSCACSTSEVWFTETGSDKIASVTY